LFRTLTDEHLEQSAHLLAQSISALDRIREAMRGYRIIETTSLQQIAESRALLQQVWLLEYGNIGKRG
jgi:hypothetical protein